MKTIKLNTISIISDKDYPRQAPKKGANPKLRLIDHVTDYEGAQRIANHKIFRPSYLHINTLKLDNVRIGIFSQPSGDIINDTLLHYTDDNSINWMFIKQQQVKGDIILREQLLESSINGCPAVFINRLVGANKAHKVLVGFWEQSGYLFEIQGLELRIEEAQKIGASLN